MIKNNRILYFVSHPIQYFSPLFRELSKETDLKVCYFSDASITGEKDKGFGQNIKWDIPLLEGYTYEFVKNYSGRRSLANNFLDVFNPGVFKILRKDNCSVVIVNGWTYSSTLMCIVFGRLFRKKIWVRAENPLNQEAKKGKIKRVLKKLFLKHLLFRFFVDKCLYIGTENKRFFEYYGVKNDDLIFTPYAVDNDFFTGEYQRLRDRQDDTRRELGLPVDKKIILFSGKYISKKNPLDLLKAFNLLNDPSCSLVMVGEGELRASMESYIAENRLSNVFLTGFVNQSEISKYYAIANVFVMCSGIGETWGLSVNEAMNFELPVIVSNTCGCSKDLVLDGINGFIFEEGDIEMLAQKMDIILSNESLAKKMGEEGLKVVNMYSISTITSNIFKAN